MNDVAPTKKPIRWGKIVLVASLSLNVLVVGLVVGTMVSGDPRVKGGQSAGDGGTRALIEALRHEDRRAIGRALGAGKREQNVERRALSAAVLDTLQAESFDKDAFRDAMIAQTAFATERYAKSATILADRLDGMTDAERAKFTERFEQGLAMHKRNGGPPENAQKR